MLTRRRQYLLTGSDGAGWPGPLCLRRPQRRPRFHLRRHPPRRAGASCPSWRSAACASRCARRRGGCACGPRRGCRSGRRWRPFSPATPSAASRRSAWPPASPTKAFLSRRHLATADAVSSLATDNLVYAASALAMVGVGVVVLLATVPLPFEWQEWGVAALVAARGRRRWPACGCCAARGRPSRGRGPRGASGSPACGSRCWRFSAANPGPAVAGLRPRHGVPRAGGARGLSHARVGSMPDAARRRCRSRSSSRRSTACRCSRSSSCPFRVGVDEALSGALAPALDVPAAVGVTLAIVRKVRNLFWAGLGLALMAGRARGRRGLKPRRYGRPRPSRFSDGSPLNRARASARTASARSRLPIEGPGPRRRAAAFWRRQRLQRALRSPAPRRRRGRASGAARARLT